MCWLGGSVWKSVRSLVQHAACVMCHKYTPRQHTAINIIPDPARAADNQRPTPHAAWPAGFLWRTLYRFLWRTLYRTRQHMTRAWAGVFAHFRLLGMR
eukprot:27702-Chlamydomonas_euryale.AAC.4